jgi:hypothetical protein
VDKPTTRELKEVALVDALNKADDASKGFFLYHLSQYGLGGGKIRDLIMKMDAEDFDLFYEEEIWNLASPEEKDRRAAEINNQPQPPGAGEKGKEA